MEGLDAIAMVAAAQLDVESVSQQFSEKKSNNNYEKAAASVTNATAIITPQELSPSSSTAAVSPPFLHPPPPLPPRNSTLPRIVSHDDASATMVPSNKDDKSKHKKKDDCNNTSFEKDGSLYVTQISDNDVLCGRGGETNYHVGNMTFRRLVKERQAEYLKAKRKEKPKIAKHIVNTIRLVGGRFLKKVDGKCTSSGQLVWQDVGDSRAREKTSQALREGAPDIRLSSSTTTVLPTSIDKNNNDNADNKNNKFTTATKKRRACSNQDASTGSDSMATSLSLSSMLKKTKFSKNDGSPSLSTKSIPIPKEDNDRFSKNIPNVPTHLLVPGVMQYLPASTQPTSTSPTKEYSQNYLMVSSHNIVENGMIGFKNFSSRTNDNQIRGPRLRILKARLAQQ